MLEIYEDVVMPALYYAKQDQRRGNLTADEAHTIYRATHELIDWCPDASIRFSVGYDLTEPVRAAILKVPVNASVPAVETDGSERENGEVCELSELVDLSSWPDGTRLICRRERPHPGAQLAFTDHDGYRFQTFLTDQDDTDIAVLEPVRDYKARHASTMLTFDAVAAAIDQIDGLREAGQVFEPQEVHFQKARRFHISHRPLGNDIGLASDAAEGDVFGEGFVSDHDRRSVGADVAGESLQLFG